MEKHNFSNVRYFRKKRSRNNNKRKVSIDDKTMIHGYIITKLGSFQLLFPDAKFQHLYIYVYGRKRKKYRCSIVRPSPDRYSSALRSQIAHFRLIKPLGTTFYPRKEIGIRNYKGDRGSGLFMAMACLKCRPATGEKSIIWRISEAWLRKISFYLSPHMR